MADESAEAAQTMMIDTTGGAGPRGGVLIGSDNPDVVTGDDEKRGVLAFLAEQERKSKFRDRRALELEAVRKQAHHTRAKIRVKMPDGYILQGTFGAKERVQAVLDFVKNCLVLKDRPFYLFETPPKRVLQASNKTLYASKLVPSCLLYFAWEDLSETKMGDGPFLDMVALRENIV